MEQRIERAPQLAQEAKTRLLAHLDELTDGDVVCHGDLHPQNVLLTKEGPVIIDWADATLGHPLADVARSSLLLGHAMSLDESINRQLETPRQRFFETYLARYRELRPFDDAELAAWKLPVFAARLAEGIAREEEVLLEIVQSRLSSISVTT